MIICIGCSSSKETNNSGNPGDEEVYVFDEVPVEKIDEKGKENGLINNDEKNYYYFVQIGAFATRKNAETLIENASKIVSEELEIIFNNRTSLYQVRIKNAFTSRNDAAILRDKIRQTEAFRDAWIVKLLK